MALMTRWVWLWLGLVGVAGATPPSFAQPTANRFDDPANRSHMPIPPRDGDPDPAALLAQRMRWAHGMSELRELAKQFLRPDEYQQLISGVSAPLDSNDPKLRKLISKMLREKSMQRPSGSQVPPDALKKLNDAVRELSGSPTPPDSVQQPKPAPSSPSRPPSTPDRPKIETPQPPVARPTPAEPKEREAAAEQLRDWLTRMQQMNGPWTEAPTVRRMVQDLIRLGVQRNGAAADPNENLEAQLARLNRELREASALWEKSRTVIGHLDLPSLPRWNWTPEIPGAVPSLPAPRVSMPEANASGSTGGLVWLGLVVLLILLLWKLFGRGWTTARVLHRSAETQLGPWPIAPDAVSTRADLVRAFEYLSLLRLGAVARTWNHREIAARLGAEAPDRRHAAEELASVYEHARYAPEQEPLPDETLAVARRALCFLAGVASA
jgi:hypothetical protein